MTMTNRVAIVTGCNKGIGFEIAKKMLEAGFKVIMACRSKDRAADAARRLQSETGSSAIEVRQLDVSDPASISAFTAGISNDYRAIDVLINNAATAFKNSDPTPFARQARPTMQSNLFGTIQLTESLLPVIKAAADPRVVFVASGAGRLAYVQSKDLVRLVSSPDLTLDRLIELGKQFVDTVEAGTHATYGFPNTCYGMSKLCIIAYAGILARNEPSIKSNACCPGYCVTDMTSHKGERTAEHGARTPAHLALAARLPTGKFFKNEEEAPW
ncbi:(+)-neomenthol dehydrogenase [Diplonema papillatum]|nr:(+)-neomenthol dehydrogenase [Diplonema papillatum]|eukprot:gene5289-8072_t